MAMSGWSNTMDISSISRGGTPSMRDVTDAEKLQWRKDHTDGTFAFLAGLFGLYAALCSVIGLWYPLALWALGVFVGVAVFFFWSARLDLVRPFTEDELNRVRARMMNQGRL
jgi:uncharacterized membrane protein YphA (DoxX/SURF4 family)